MELPLSRSKVFPELFSILYKIEQNSQKRERYHSSVFQEETMAPLKEWRFEVCNPRKSPEWQPLFGIDDEELKASLELRDELNKINSPIMVRVVRNFDAH